MGLYFVKKKRKIKRFKDKFFVTKELNLSYKKILKIHLKKLEECK